MAPGKTSISGPNPVFMGSELVLALVAPVGTDLDKFQNLLDRVMKKFHYKSNQIRLSKLADYFKYESKEHGELSDEASRISCSMDKGNYLRSRSQRGETLALAAASDIKSLRNVGNTLPNALPKRVHVIRSLKHPDEVRALRRIYGGGFFLVGVTVDEDIRRKYLRDQKGCTTEEVDMLLCRDEHEEDPRYIGPDGQNYGQRTRDTFQLADVFIPLDSESLLLRFMSLIFGCPFETPTKDEHAMFLAFGAALRSGDLSRQVGAVVVSEAGDVVSVGTNDVARAGGGLYWPGPEDERDFKRGEDSNEVQRDIIIQTVLDRLCPDGQDLNDWSERGRKLLKGSPLMDITEYGRATHAEMEALLSCARSGISTRNATLYSTTFPCHNCAKHIIAAGVSRVVYVEPYPKSLAKTLFSDSITLEEDSHVEAKTEANPKRRVRFEHFVGVGARRFFDLFSIGLSTGTQIVRKKGGKNIDWTPDKGIVRVPCLPNSYLEREILAEAEFFESINDPEATK